MTQSLAGPGSEKSNRNSMPRIIEKIFNVPERSQPAPDNEKHKHNSILEPVKGVSEVPRKTLPAPDPQMSKVLADIEGHGISGDLPRTDIATPAGKRKLSLSNTAIDKASSQRDAVPRDTTVPREAKRPKTLEAERDETSNPGFWGIPILSIATSGVVVRADENGPALQLFCASKSKQFVCYCGRISLSNNIPSLTFNATTVFKIVRDKLNTSRDRSAVRVILGDRDDCRQVIDLEIRSKEDCKSFLTFLKQITYHYLDIE